MTDDGVKLIVGLGNPGQNYKRTRHNAGFWLVESLAEKENVDFCYMVKFNGWVGVINISGKECKLFLPETFMNLSGEAVGKIVRFYKFSSSSILVAHDELDFAPGVVRIKQGGGANGHNGVQNIIDNLGDANFWRLRIGIGKPKFKEEMSNYVLSIPNKLEYQEISDAISRAHEIIPELIFDNYSQARLKLHTV